MREGREGNERGGPLRSGLSPAGESPVMGLFVGITAERDEYVFLRHHAERDEYVLSQASRRSVMSTFSLKHHDGA